MKQNFERKLENLKELLLNPQNVQRKVYEERNRIIPMLVESEKWRLTFCLNVHGASNR